MIYDSQESARDSQSQSSNVLDSVVFMQLFVGFTQHVTHSGQSASKPQVLSTEQPIESVSPETHARFQMARDGRVEGAPAPILCLC